MKQIPLRNIQQNGSQCHRFWSTHKTERAQRRSTKSCGPKTIWRVSTHSGSRACSYSRRLQTQRDRPFGRFRCQVGGANCIFAAKSKIHI